MTFKAELQSFDQLSEAEQETASDNGYGKKWASYIRVTHNGETLYLESDACEPEDKRFMRDLSWIVDALMKAYEAGLSDAGKQP